MLFNCIQYFWQILRIFLVDKVQHFVSTFFTAFQNIFQKLQIGSKKTIIETKVNICKVTNLSRLIYAQMI